MEGVAPSTPVARRDPFSVQDPLRHRGQTSRRGNTVHVPAAPKERRPPPKAEACWCRRTRRPQGDWRRPHERDRRGGTGGPVAASARPPTTGVPRSSEVRPDRIEFSPPLAERKEAWGWRRLVGWFLSLPGIANTKPPPPGLLSRCSRYDVDHVRTPPLALYASPTAAGAKNGLIGYDFIFPGLHNPRGSTSRLRA
jgi:hypothetical protein